MCLFLPKTETLNALHSLQYVLFYFICKEVTGFVNFYMVLKNSDVSLLVLQINV